MSRLAVTTLEDRRTPAAYTLDSTFGDAGRLQRDANTVAGPIAVQADGKVVSVEQEFAGFVTGTDATYTTYLRRYNADGSRDTTFGSTGASGAGGEILVDAPGSRPVEVALDAENRPTVLLVSDTGFTLASPGRFEPVVGPTDGALQFADLQLLPDGTALVAGQKGTPASNPTRTTIQVFRVTRLGEIDLAASREFTPELGPLADPAPGAAQTPPNRTTDLLLRPDGVVYLARAQSGASPGGVVRLNVDGMRDGTFDFDGIQVIAASTDIPNRTATTLFATPDGGVLLGGSSTRDGDVTGIVTRLLPSGAFDTTFGSGGTVLIAASEGLIALENALVGSDGSVVLVGNRSPATTIPFVGSAVYIGLVRAGSTVVESLDGPFDDSGVTTPGLGGSAVFDSALAPDDKLVLSGQLDQPATTFRGKLARVELPAAVVEPVVPPVVEPPVVEPVVVEPPVVDPVPPPVETPLIVLPPVPTPVVPPVIAPTPPRPAAFVPPSALTLNGPNGGRGGRATIAENAFAFAAPVAPSFGSGVLTRTASADLTRDGVPDLIAVSGRSGGSRVALLDGATGRRISEFSVFERAFTGGVFVATADLTGDGVPDVVVTPDVGGGPVVAVYDGARLAQGLGGDLAQIIRFYGIEDPAFRGGVRPALADFNNDGRAELVIAAGDGGGPRVMIWDGASVVAGQPLQLANFFAFEPAVRNGVYVSVGDLDGDNVPELAFGGGPGGGPRVRVAQASTFISSIPTVATLAPRLEADFFAFNPEARGGAQVAVRDIGSGGAPSNQLVVGSGAGEPGRVRVYRPGSLSVLTPIPDLDLAAFDGVRLPNGVYVG